MTQSFPDTKEKLKVKNIKKHLFHANFWVNEVTGLFRRSGAIVSIL